MNLELVIKREGTKFKVVADSPLGERSKFFEVNSALQSKMYDIDNAVKDQEPLSEEFVKELGIQLFELLFSGIKDLFHECLGKSDHVTVILNTKDPELSKLPWELSYDNDSDSDTLLGADPLCSLVRRDQKSDQSFEKIDYPLKVLVITSSPMDLDEKGQYQPDPDELVELMEPLKTLEDEGKVRIDFLERASVRCIQDKLKEGYHIVHFVGHGYYNDKTKKGFLVIEDKNRNSKKLTDSELALLFGVNPPQLLILTACESAPLIQSLLIKKIPAVMAMQYTVLKDIAHEFVERFYSLLVKGDTVSQAVSVARSAVLLEEGIENPGWFTPVLYVRSDNSLTINTESKPVKPEKKAVKRIDMSKDLIGAENFVGRRKDLWLVEKALFEDNLKLVLVTGIGGIGKSALASKFLKRHKCKFKGIFAKKVVDPSMGVEGILLSLDQFLLQNGDQRFHNVIEEPDLDYKLEILNSCLENYLLVLDNFEVLLEDSYIKDSNVEKFLQAVLFGDHTSKVIITSRYQFTFADEKAGGLVNHVDLNELSLQFARLLLEKREMRDHEIQRKVHQKVGGNPQFLEFFVGLARTRPTEQLLKDITPVREKIDEWLLHELVGVLTEEGKEVMKKGSVFRRPVEKDGFSSVGASDEVLENLVYYSLVKVEKGRDENNKEYTHYFMHQAVRDYCYGLLSEDEKVKAHSKAVIYYNMLFEKEKGDFFDIFELHHHLVESEQYEEAGNLVLGLFEPLYLRGFREELIVLLMQTIETTRDKIKAGGFFDLGKVLDALGNYKEAEKCYEESLDLFESLEDKYGISQSLHQLGVIHQYRGEYAEAEKLYRKSLDILKKLGDTAGEARSLHQLAMIHQYRGEYAEAEKLYRESLDIKKKLGDTAGEAQSLHQLGVIHQYRGEYAEAVKNYITSLEILSNLGSPDAETVAESLQRMRVTIGEEQFDHYWKTVTKEEVPDSIKKSPYKDLEDLIQYILYIVETNNQEEIEKTTETLTKLLKEVSV